MALTLDLDALLFDAGGVLVLPDPTVLGPAVAPYGGSTDHEAHRRAHYAAMAAKSHAEAGETEWGHYDATYVEHLGVPDRDRSWAAAVLGSTRNAMLWRHRVDDSAAALAELDRLGVPIGVVSNASGQIEETLLRAAICQVGDGPGAPVRCVVDSHVVGVAKPDPTIFEHALVHFEGIERSRIGYVGDSVTMDVGGARAAGLHPILIDPFDDHAGAGFDRISSVGALLRDPDRPTTSGR